MKDIYLILANIVGICSVIPYLRDMLKHTTKPNLVSWLTWTMLTGIATAAEINAHEYRTALFTGVATLSSLSIVLLGLQHGFVKYTRFDAVCQMSAIVGIMLWQLFDSPLVGVIATVVIDLIGSLPTIRHCWQKPYEETYQTYVWFGVGGALALASLVTYNWTSTLYAIYIVVLDVIMTSVILYRRQRAYSKG